MLIYALLSAAWKDTLRFPQVEEVSLSSRAKAKPLNPKRYRCDTEIL